MSLYADLTEIHNALCAVEKPVRILRSLAWPARVREDFFAADGKRLPVVEYPAFPAAEVLRDLHEVRRMIKRKVGTENTMATWLLRLTDNVENGALLLANTAKPAFLEYSSALYGVPADRLPDNKTSVLKLSESFDATLAKLDALDLDLPSEAFTAAALAELMEQAVAKRFGDAAPRIEVVDELSANALAGPSRIRLRRGAQFTDKDVAQLINHEAFIHVATALNGRRQPHLPMLARSHPGTTKTQEGLAVFAEFITGSMELDRLRRLTDRVIAIQMAIDGADFIEVYNYFLTRTNGRQEQSFENTRRVFRGGIVSGGTAFTKDIVYLEGLLKVHNFLRVAVSAGRADLLHLLFCGKLDIEDLGALAELAAAGYCKPPVFLPPWAEDLRFLLSYLAYSSFLNTVNLSALRHHYGELTQTAPKLNTFVKLA